MATKTTDWRPGPTVCRCCLSEGCYKDISTEYFWMGKREVYAEMLLDTYNLKIAYSKSGGPNSNSRLICEPCISRLRDATDFKRQVEECEKTFMQYLDPATTSNAVLDVTSASQIDFEVKVEQVKMEKPLSDTEDFDDRPDFGDDDDDDDDLDDQPLMNLATKGPKKESIQLMDLLDDAKAGDKRKSTTKPKSSPAKKTKSVIKLKKDTAKPSSSKSSKTEKKKKGSEPKWKPRRKYNDQRHNAAIIIECSNACPFRWNRGYFVCAYCPLSFGDMSAIKNHTVEHPSKLEAMRFLRAPSFVKIEITNLRCELCGGKMKDINDLRDHLISEHNKPIKKNFDLGVTPFISDDKWFICAHCNEKFELFTKLNTHINQHYPNNICFECGKAFSAEQRLQAHLATHESSNNEFKCTRCDEVFETRVLRNSHLALVHGPQYRYRCPYCKDSFKSYGDRVKHLKSEHGKKIEYPCHLCSSVFSLCNQRTKHIKQVHIKLKKFLCNLCPNQFVTAAQLKNHMVRHTGERNFKCEICTKAYPRPKTLREHMRIHNDDKRFVCEFCNQAFVQKTSLKNHLRAHHPVANPEILKKSRQQR